MVVGLDNMNWRTPQNGFTLIDSVDRSRAHPETWAHPDEEALKQIEVGYFVKVGVEHPDLSGERFWGLVKEKTGHGIMIRVDQDMLYTTQHGIADEDLMLVTERNVFGIMTANGVRVWEPK
jgi:hypothetical protein